MKLSMLLPTLFQPLAERAIASFNRTGDKMGAELEIVVVSPFEPSGDNVVWVRDVNQAGCYVASKEAWVRSTGDICLWVCDDVVFLDGWFNHILSRYIKLQASAIRPFILGMRHTEFPGTCFGRYYANFPMFERKLADCPLFCPEWLHGQWGDSVFSNSVWLRGGTVYTDKRILAEWPSDRLGCGESRFKVEAHDLDRQAVIKNFSESLGRGWPLDYYRGFNINAPARLLELGSTICEPDFFRFMELIRYAGRDRMWRCNHCNTTALDRMSLPFVCMLNCELV